MPPVDDGLARIGGVRVLGACDNYTPGSSGGAEKAGHELYSRFGRAGAQVRVISVPHGVPYDDPGVEVVTAKGTDLSGLVGGYFCPSLDSWRKAKAQFEEFRPDVLHVNTIHYSGCIALARLAAQHEVPLVVTAQLGPVTEMPFLTRLAGSSYDMSLGRYVVRRASAVLAVSETVKAHMISIGADPARVSVVENGVDHERFACEPLEPNDDPLIVAIGRIVDNKGPHLLVDAAIDLARRGRRFRVAFLGDGPMRADLERRVEREGLADRVRFEGQVTDVERWLARADIVVRPSFTEGLPLAVLEAMSAGRCNVVSDIPPNRELIQHDVSGLVFATGDAVDLAAQLDRVIQDAELRLRLAGVGREASLTRSWDRMACETAAALVQDLPGVSSR